MNTKTFAIPSSKPVHFSPDPRPRILILDDDPYMQMALSKLLALDGIESASASASDEAFALAKRSIFDVLIADIAHLGVNGLAILPRWRQLHPHISVVAISPHLENDRTREQAMQLGATACLPKPFNVDQLRSAIQPILSTPSQRN